MSGAAPRRQFVPILEKENLPELIFRSYPLVERVVSEQG